MRTLVYVGSIFVLLCLLAAFSFAFRGGAEADALEFEIWAITFKAQTLALGFGGLGFLFFALVTILYYRDSARAFGSHPPAGKRSSNAAATHRRPIDDPRRWIRRLRGVELRRASARLVAAVGMFASLGFLLAAFAMVWSSAKTGSGAIEFALWGQTVKMDSLSLAFGGLALAFYVASVVMIYRDNENQSVKKKR